MFPMNQQAMDLQMGAPGDVDNAQLRDLHIRVNMPKEWWGIGCAIRIIDTQLDLFDEFTPQFKVRSLRFATLNHKYSCLW